MIEFRTLGGIDLTGSQGQRVSSLLHQPKRVAVFAYLATTTGGFQRRDELLALLWPDTDHERASSSLSRSLHYIQRSLGSAVLETEGGNVRVASGAVWCDTAEFWTALAQGQLERALGLYRGRFLDGFFIGDAPDFERWSDREQARLQGAALDAALTLAERDADQPDRARALRWARRGIEISPYDERPLRLVMRLLGEIGDHPSVRVTYESFARRLKGDWGVDPSPETVELVARLSTPAADLPAAAPTAVAATEPTAMPAAAAAADREEACVPDRVIKLRTLGGIDLTGSHGQRASSLLHQPKRAAIFTYLAAATPGGFQGRDKLLALFWPDADHERASHSLSQSLYYIRRSLGRAVLETEGGNVRVARGVVWCDAAEFREALTQGQFERALSLYRGSFLDGFFIGDAPDFERWADQEKARLQEAALEAALTLAKRETDHSDRAGALRWARCGIEISPYEERPLRLVMRLLGEIGDRPSALVAYESFARRLKGDLGIDPSPQTVELAAMLSTPTADPPARAATAVATTEPAPLPAAAAAATEATREGADADDQSATAPTATPGGVVAIRHFMRWSANALVRHRPRVVAAVVALLAAVVWRASDAVAPATSARGVVILPFSYQGDARYAYLADGLPELLGIDLDDLEHFEVVEPRALLSWARDWKDPELTHSDGHAAAHHFGAGQYVLGSIIEAGGQFQITATLYRVGGDAVTTFQGRIEDESQIFGLVDDLARTMIASRYEGRPNNLPQLAAVTTRSLPALKKYLAGEKAFRAGQYQQALEAFNDAATQDSTFAIAWYRLSAVAGWVRGDERKAVQERAAAAAIRHSARLTRTDRLLIEAQKAFIQGMFVSARSELQSLLSRQPENLQAWFKLGEVGYHYNPLLGASVTDAAEPFEQVLARDPEHVESLKHLAGIRASEGRFTDLDSLVRRMLAVEDDRLLLDYQALHAAALDDERLMAGVLAKLNGAAPRECRKAASLVARMLRDPTETEPLVQTCLRTARTLTDRARAYVWLAHVHLAGGKIAAAHEALRMAARHEPQEALEYRVSFALEPFLPSSATLNHESQDSRGARDHTVARRQSGAERASSPSGSGNGDDLASLTDAVGTPASHQGAYLGALLAAKRGEYTNALDQAARLERLPGASDEFRRALAQSVRAEVQRLGNDADSALSLLETVAGEMVELSYYRILESPIVSFARERFLRAELLRQQGRHIEALDWYGSLGQQSLHELIYVAPSHLGQARIYEELGDPAAAAAHYARFLELWDEADPDLQPIVDSALAELRRVSSEQAARSAPAS